MAVRMRIFRPLQEPIGLQDLLNSALSRAKKKMMIIIITIKILSNDLDSLNSVIIFKDTTTLFSFRNTLRCFKHHHQPLWMFSNFKVAQSNFQHFPRRRFWCVIITNSLSIDAAIMVSKNSPVISKHVVIIFITLYVTRAIVWPAKSTLNFCFKYFYCKNGTAKFFFIIQFW